MCACWKRLSLDSFAQQSPGDTQLRQSTFLPVPLVPQWLSLSNRDGWEADFWRDEGLWQSLAASSGLHHHYVPCRAALATGLSCMPQAEHVHLVRAQKPRHGPQTSISSGSKATVLGPWPLPGRRTPEIEGLGAWGEFRIYVVLSDF